MRIRKTKNLDNQSFDTDLMKPLDDGHGQEISFLEGMVNQYNRLLHDVLDKHAPIRTKKCVIKNNNHSLQRILEI